MNANDLKGRVVPFQSADTRCNVPPACERCEQAANHVRSAGHTVSAGSWHSDERCFAFSVATIPGTYGHPKSEKMVRAAAE